MTAFVAVNRVAITDALVRVWGRFWATVAKIAVSVRYLIDRFVLFRVIRVSVDLLTQSMRNLWAMASGGSGKFVELLLIIGVQLIALVERITRFGAANVGSMGVVGKAWTAFSRAVQDVLWLLLGNKEMIRTGWVAQLPATLARAQEMFRETIQLAKDLGNALVFNDSAVSEDNKWIVKLRDELIATAGIIATTVLGIAVSIVASIQSTVVAAAQTIGRFAADVAREIKELAQIAKDFAEILRFGDAAQPKSHFMKGWKDDLVAVRNVIVEIFTYIGRFWTMFKDVMGGLKTAFDPILKLFGFNFEQAALFVGVLKFTGLLGLLTAGVGKAFAALTGLFGLATWLPALIAQIAGVGAAVNAAQTGAAAGAAGAAGAVGAAGGVWGGVKNLAKGMLGRATVLGGAAVGGWMAGEWGGQAAWDNDVFGVRSAFGDDEAQAAAARQSPSWHRQIAQYPVSAPSYVPEQVEAAVSRGDVAPGIDVWSGSRRSVDVNFNVGGRTFTGSYEPNVADDMVRYLSDRSRRGGL